MEITGWGPYVNADLKLMFAIMVLLAITSHKRTLALCNVLTQLGIHVVYEYRLPIYSMCSLLYNRVAGQSLCLGYH